VCRGVGVGIGGSPSHWSTRTVDLVGIPDGLEDDGVETQLIALDGLFD